MTTLSGSLRAACIEALGEVRRRSVKERLTEAEWFGRHLMVKDELGEIVPFVLRPAQQEFSRDCTGRDIILKARKEGFSTYVAARFYRDVTTQPGTNAAMVAHTPDARQTLWDIVQRFHRHDPRRDSAGLRTKYSSRRELYFDAMDSRFEVLLASEGAGRSATLRRLHISELAWWKGDARGVLGGMIAAVPQGQGEIIVESTANGEGNEYHRRWIEAVDGRSGYQGHFFPWTAHATYRRPWPGGDMSPEEKALQRAYDLDIEQVAFWRWAVAEYGEDLANQEFPITPEVAFLASGRKVFDGPALVELEQAFRSDPKSAERWGRDSYLHVYAAPRRSRRYVAGADTSEGVPGGDYQDARVLDAESLEEVACLHGHWPIHVFARKLSALVKPYRAFTVVERNNHGHAVLEHLVRGEDALRIPREQLYYHRGYDQRGKIVRKPGWPTDGKTKPIMVAELEEAIRRRWLRAHDPLFYREARAYAHLEDGSMGAPEGAHDDSVMAMALALQARKQLGSVGYQKTRIPGL